MVKYKLKFELFSSFICFCKCSYLHRVRTQKGVTGSGGHSMDTWYFDRAGKYASTVYLTNLIMDR